MMKAYLILADKHQGYQGVRGTPGIPGTQGEKGERGDLSFTGKLGIPGPKGNQCVLKSSKRAMLMLYRQLCNQCHS